MKSSPLRLELLQVVELMQLVDLTRRQLMQVLELLQLLGLTSPAADSPEEKD